LPKRLKIKHNLLASEALIYLLQSKMLNRLKNTYFWSYLDAVVTDTNIAFGDQTIHFRCILNKIIFY
jgi:hypothetical protein